MTRKTTTYARKRAQGHGTRPADPFTLARVYVTRLRPHEVARIMQPCNAALAAARSAAMTHAQWVVLCTAGHVAESIEDGGVIRGQREIIDAANEALEAIGGRCGRTEQEWKPKACTGPELTALADLVAAHSRQVHELTYREYTTAVDRAVARVASTGGEVFKAEEAQT